MKQIVSVNICDETPFCRSSERSSAHWVSVAFLLSDPIKEIY